MIDLSIYGIEGSSHDYVKHLILAGIKGSEVKLQFCDFHNVNDFISEGIGSVPAVRFNQKPIIEKDTGETITGFVRRVVQNILEEENYGSIQKVLVPVDFSGPANNAFYFATQLSRRLNFLVQLVHVYDPVLFDINGRFIFNPDEKEHVKAQFESLKEDLNQDWIGDFMGSPLVEGIFLMGSPCENIVDIQSKENFSFVVMGAKGQNSTSPGFFGKVANYAVRKSFTPLFIVPPDASFQPFENILYLCRDLPLAVSDSAFPIRLAEIFKSSVHLMSTSPVLQKTSQQKEIKYLNQSFSSTYWKELKFNGDIRAEIVEDHAARINANLIAIHSCDTGLFMGLTKNSESKDWPTLRKTPLLIVQDAV